MTYIVSSGALNPTHSRRAELSQTGGFITAKFDLPYFCVTNDYSVQHGT